jgi:hypothetical protein
MEVIHVKQMKSEDVYIGRKTGRLRGSPLGNPYKVGEHGSREEVIRKYEEWLEKQILAKGIVYEEIEKLVKLYKNNPNLRLACWCSPQRCHGEVVIRMVEKMAKEM